MSLNDGEKRKALIPMMSDNGSGAPVPTSKRQKTNNNNAVAEQSILFNTHPDILRKVYSFLTLKEALVLRRTHRHFNESSNDIYQYSVIMNDIALEKQGLVDKERTKYLASQTQGLCNLVDNENLRAVLRNESLRPDFVASFILELANHSRIDNGQAVSILLQDDRCNATCLMLERMLRDELTAMPAVLQQDERVKKDIQMCRICSDHIGCYGCTTCDENPDKTARYCFDCAFLEGNSFCEKCNEFLCPICRDEGAFASCEKCGGIECLNCEAEFLTQCESCDRKKCEACIAEDREDWSNRFRDESVCPNCENRDWREEQIEEESYSSDEGDDCVVS